MNDFNALACVLAVVAEIFERDAALLSAKTHLMQDLPCESIDLLEIAARLSREAGREVDDDALFLRNARVMVQEHPGQTVEQVLAASFPWIGEVRRAEIAEEIKDPAPFVTLGDMASYLAFLMTK